MEDVFYFNERQVYLLQFSKVAIDLGFDCKIYDELNGQSLTIFITERVWQKASGAAPAPRPGLSQTGGFWHVSPINWRGVDDLDLSERGEEALAAMNPVVAFDIELDYWTYEPLRLFARAVLDEFGGWLSLPLPEWSDEAGALANCFRADRLDAFTEQMLSIRDWPPGDIC